MVCKKKYKKRLSVLKAFPLVARRGIEPLFEE